MTTVSAETPITELGLSVRSGKCMRALGITTIAELIARSGKELLKCKNFGATSLAEIREKLAERGFKLKDE